MDNGAAGRCGRYPGGVSRRRWLGSERRQVGGGLGSGVVAGWWRGAGGRSASCDGSLRLDGFREGLGGALWSVRAGAWGDHAGMRGAGLTVDVSEPRLAMRFQDR